MRKPRPREAVICWRSYRQRVPELDLSSGCQVQRCLCHVFAHSTVVIHKSSLKKSPWSVGTQSNLNTHSFQILHHTRGWELKRARASERSHSKLLMENGASTPPAEFTLLNLVWLHVGVGQDVVSRGQVCVVYSSQLRRVIFL